MRRKSAKWWNDEIYFALLVEFEKCELMKWWNDEMKKCELLHFEMMKWWNDEMKSAKWWNEKCEMMK